MAKKMTIEETIVAGLVAMGFKEIDSKSRKYRLFPRVHDSYIYFVGKAGALRIGPSLSNHTPVPDRLREQVLARGRGEEIRRVIGQRYLVQHGQTERCRSPYYVWDIAEKSVVFESSDKTATIAKSQELNGFTPTDGDPATYARQRREQALS
jgi:hypothetical protein